MYCRPLLGGDVGAIIRPIGGQAGLQQLGHKRGSRALRAVLRLEQGSNLPYQRHAIQEFFACGRQKAARGRRYCVQNAPEEPVQNTGRPLTDGGWPMPNSRQQVGNSAGHLTAGDWRPSGGH